MYLTKYYRRISQNMSQAILIFLSPNPPKKVCLWITPLLETDNAFKHFKGAKLSALKKKKKKEMVSFV